MQAGQEFPEDPFLGPRAKKRNDVSDLKPGAIRLDVGPQRVCHGGSIAECDTKQDWREWVDVLTRILSRNVSRQSVRVSAADLTLDNGRVVYPRFGIGNPATGFGVFMPVGGPGTPTFASFLAASFLPFVVYNDPTFNPARYDVNRDLRTVVDVMEHTYDFSADTTSLAQYLRSGRKGYRVAGDRRHADVAHRYDSVL